MAMQANLEHKQIIGLLELKQEEHMARIELMEKHAKEKAEFQQKELDRLQIWGEKYFAEEVAAKDRIIEELRKEIEVLQQKLSNSKAAE